MINPFRIPGPHDDPVRPLCPWKEHAHAGYYADVDHTAESFALFTEQMDVDWLRGNGRLVAVAGGKGCGKTSLINRCVHWLQTKLRDQGLVIEVVDLTRASDSSSTVTERMTEVSSQLADRVKMRNLAQGDRLQDVLSSAGQPETLYPRLSHALNDRMILVILLPPIELLPVVTERMEEEIRKYSRYANAKLVLFMEVTLAEDPERLAEWRAGSAPPLLVLPVLPLKAGDGELFSSTRLNLHTGGEVFPRLDPEAQRKIVAKNISVKFVQSLLYNVYEERRIKGHRYTTKDLVTFGDIAEFFYNRRGDV